MQSRALLMIEHRLIEKMIALMARAKKEIEDIQAIDPYFIDAVVDFIHTYADRTHHGKEEDILFRRMADKNLSTEDRRLMNELVEDHVFGRKVVAKLVAANERYKLGDDDCLSDISANLGILADFYPKHIEKEDKVFFPASMAYITPEEDGALLAAYLEFDQKMIHEKYRSLVEELVRR